MNILTNKLPVEVNIDGVLCKINSDYRTSIIFSKLIEDNEVTEDLILEILNLYYPVIPQNIEQAIDKISWFYECGKSKDDNSNNSTGSYKKVFDYDEDSQYIYSAFLSQYRIDLQEVEYLHWWKFKALFEALDDNNEIIKIMKYRSIDLSKIQDKEQRNFYKKMQENYKLKEKVNEADLQALDEMRKLLVQ